MRLKVVWPLETLFMSRSIKDMTKDEISMAEKEIFDMFLKGGLKPDMLEEIQEPTDV